MAQTTEEIKTPFVREYTQDCIEYISNGQFEEPYKFRIEAIIQFEGFSVTIVVFRLKNQQIDLLKEAINRIKQEIL